MLVSKENYEKLTKFVEFLKTQPADETMANGNISDCMMTRFYRANVPGAIRSSYVFSEWMDAEFKSHEYFTEDNIGTDLGVFLLIPVSQSRTYGEAAAKAAELLSQAAVHK